MLLLELRTEVARYARKMYTSQLVRASQGNISARDPESGLICIKPSGGDYESLSAEDIVVIDEHGHVIEGKWNPSTETPLHTLILRRRRDIHCVMHTHSFYASAFSVVHKPVPVILAESASCLGGEVPVTPYMRSGTEEFAKLVAETLGNGAAIIWGNHGAMAVGTNLSHVFSVAHALEDSAKIYTIARQLGDPVTLPTEEVKQLHELWLEHYRLETRKEVHSNTKQPETY